MLRGTKILFSWKLDLWTCGDSWGRAAVHLWKFTAQASQERRKASRDGGADETESEGKGDHLQSPKPAPGLRRKTSPYKLYKPHGLNINYCCESCGNYTYHGLKPSSSVLLNSVTLMAWSVRAGTTVSTSQM